MSLEKTSKTVCEVSRHLRCAVALLMAMGLVACSTPASKKQWQTTGKVSRTTRTLPSGQPPPGWEPVAMGSGYYLDDGPAQYRPINLDQLPDAVPELEPINLANTRPYEVMGQSFVPQQSLEEPYKEKGRASWYGRKFHGAKTANGEIYDMYQMTAAHPTLPLPCYARITNLSNGRSIIVRVNDRGPFLRNRVMDLSYAAALKLDYIQDGSAEVVVEKLTPNMVLAYRNRMGDQLAMSQTMRDVDRVSNQAAALAATPVAKKEAMTDATAKSAAISAVSGSKNVFLQLGAFGQSGNADALMRNVMDSPGFNHQARVLMQQGLYRVIIGPFAGVQQASDAAIELAASVPVKPVIKEDLILP